MTELTKKASSTVFILGIFVLAILSVVGMVYLTQMAFSDKKQADGQFCGNTNTTQRNIARLAVVLYWIQFTWLVIGALLQNVWGVEVY